MKKKFFLFSIIIVIVISFILIINTYKKSNQIKSEEKLAYINDIKEAYSKYVITTKESNLYDSKHNIIGKINKGVKISLKDKNIESEVDDYFELEKFENHFIFYKDIKPTDSLDPIDTSHKRYLVFNENCTTTDKTKFYDKYFNFLYEINKSVNLPIYIKEQDYYGVDYAGELLYLKKDDVEVITAQNTTEQNAKDIPVLLYHFFHDHNRYESLSTVISMRADKFDDQIKYLTENNYMTLKMKDLEYYLDGKVQIQEDSVCITIDDGNDSVYIYAHPIIHKYFANATVFAITSQNEHSIDFADDLLEIHSHTHDMHKTGYTSVGQGGLFQIIDHDSGVLDLKKSRELLNGSEYLAYPFGEYTDSSIQIAKDAGIKMAFTTEWRNAKVGDDKYKVPRKYMYNEYSLEKFIELIK